MKGILKQLEVHQSFNKLIFHPKFPSEDSVLEDGEHLKGRKLHSIPLAER